MHLKNVFVRGVDNTEVTKPLFTLENTHSAIVMVTSLKSRLCNFTGFASPSVRKCIEYGVHRPCLFNVIFQHAHAQRIT